MTETFEPRGRPLYDVVVERVLVGLLVVFVLVGTAVGDTDPWLLFGIGVAVLVCYGPRPDRVPRTVRWLVVAVLLGVLAYLAWPSVTALVG